MFSFILAGVLRPPHPPGPSPLTPTTPYCCDSGNGANCKPLTGPGQVITYNGQQYGLLRSEARFVEGNLHVHDTGIKVGPSQYPLIENSTEKHGLDFPQVQTYCNRPNPITEPRDLYFKKNPPDPYMFMKPGWTTSQVGEYCTSIPDDELVFVCKANCHPGVCSFPSNDPTVKCYGDDKTVYDVYFRLSDVTNPGVPDFIKNCDKGNIQSQNPTQGPAQISMMPPDINKHPNSMKSLQLKNFSFNFNPNITVPWFSPLCKPALYFYPPRTEQVHVQIAPQGKITYTNPAYPANGWDIIASPDGVLQYQNKQYEYLYYEAQIPPEKLEVGGGNVDKEVGSGRDTVGYVIAYADLETFFESILPKLGLNEKEKNDFKDYWMKALPKSPYYLISLVPENVMRKISPLTISPVPDSLIRITLNFQPLDKKISAFPPVLQEVKRTGFTVVEWGGTFKQDRNHPFTCLM